MEKTAGQKLRDLRGSRSMQEVADAVNISVSALSQYERDLRNPRDSVKIRLAEYYGKKIERIFF